MSAPRTEAKRASRTAVLATLLRAELTAGILGLRLFTACVVLATVLLAAVWMLGSGLSEVLIRNGPRILGGDLTVSVANVPLDEALVADLGKIGQLSQVVELRSSAAAATGARATVELKAVDDVYPLYGALELEAPAGFSTALAVRDGLPGTVVEAALLVRLEVALGDRLFLGEEVFEIRGLLQTEPDRLSAGFLVGPRVLIHRDQLAATGLSGFGSLAEYGYRLKLPAGVATTAALERLGSLEPARGWEVETPGDASERVRRTVQRTTTFLGIAGVVALAVGLAGAWAAAGAWVGRRARTIALYRLSGASPGLVVMLHAVVLAVAAVAGVALGFALATALATLCLDQVAAHLHLLWRPRVLLEPGMFAAAALLLGLAGASLGALAHAARTPPSAVMAAGAGGFGASLRHTLAGTGVIGLAVLVAVAGLPVPELALTAAAGLAAVAGLLGGSGWALAHVARRWQPRGFVGVVAVQGLAIPPAAAAKALAIGIGIAGITAIVAAQGSLQQALRQELPERIPDLFLIDVQPGQVTSLAQRVADDPALGGFEATPNMRMQVLEVNGVPAREALVTPRKAWVIEGDRSFSWAAEPTAAELLAGEWWPVGYDGELLLSAEEDLAEAFLLEPGDRLTFSVLGRTFRGEVVNIRKEYHRNFRPDFLLLATPGPFRNAPHSWIATVMGDGGGATDRFIAELGRTAPNVTPVDVRRIVSQATEVLDAAVLGSLAVALTLLVAGALSLAAVTASDVDARRREALAFTLIGASRWEIGWARLAEAGIIGLLAAVLGGVAGQLGGLWLVVEGLRVDWAPGVGSMVLPAGLGLLAALAAGAAGGLGALPRGRGAVARHLMG